MGIEFHYYCFDGPVDDLEDYHSDFQLTECDRYGSDIYAGHLGTLSPGVQIINRKPFSTEKGAVEYLEENHQKFLQAMAVPFKGKVYDYNAESKRMVARREKAEANLVELRQSVLQEIKITKSKTIGCKNCGSSITRRLLHGPDCPVCSKKEIFYSNTQSKRIAVKKNQLEQTLKQQTLTKVLKPGICYAVGGNCAC